jgi:Sulfotransferase family
MAEHATLERPTVIYLMGAGHSGSSILGVTLGNCEDCFYAGEVEEWLVRSGQPQWGGTERAGFWSRVTEDVDGDDLFGAEVNRYVERSSAALRWDRWLTRRRLLGRYRRVAGDLLRAIARIADAGTVIDSSHFPLRARELQKVTGIELYLVFLVRDPQSVVDSNTRELSTHEVAERRWRALSMNANLWLTQLLSVFVFLRHPHDRRIFLRYEDFVADPEQIVRQILDTVGSSAAIPDLDALRIDTPLQGNRLLRSDVIALRRAPVTTPAWSLLTALMQRPFTPVLTRLRPAVTVRDRPEETSHSAAG